MTSGLKAALFGGSALVAGSMYVQAMSEGSWWSLGYLFVFVFMLYLTFLCLAATIAVAHCDHQRMHQAQAKKASDLLNNSTIEIKDGHIFIRPIEGDDNNVQS